MPYLNPLEISLKCELTSKERPFSGMANNKSPFQIRIDTCFENGNLDFAVNSKKDAF